MSGGKKPASGLPLAAGLALALLLAKVAAPQEAVLEERTHAETPSAARFGREQWGLDEAEWQRYLSLMAGIRGSLSQPSISPVEVLGIHARSEAERDRYAQRFAKLMQEDTERVLAFQRAYGKAWQGLNPSGLVADKSRLPRSQKTDRPRPGGRLLLFIPQGVCPGCEKLVRAALDGRRAGARLDIYFTGGPPDDAIRQWARSHRIDPADVEDRRVTLNHEHGELAQVAPGRAAPALAQIQAGQTIFLNGLDD